MLNKFKKKIDLPAVYLSILFLLVINFAPSVKVYFALALLYFALLTYFYSFVKALIYATPILINIWIGQTHSLLIIPPKALWVDTYIEGRHLSWNINPYLMISVAAILLIPLMQKRFKKRVKLLKHEKLIVVLTASGILSAIYGAILLELSLFYVISSFLTLIWVYYFILLKNNVSNNNWQKILTTFLLIFIILINYEAILVFLQMLLKRPIGLLVEPTQMATVFGLGADEGGASFRPFGFAYHPNGLANNHLISLFIILTLNNYLKKMPKLFEKLCIFTAIVSGIVILISLSRAAYIALFFAFLFIYFRRPKKVRLLLSDFQKIIKKIDKKYKVFFFLISLLLIFRLSNRLLNSIYSFSETGGISTRLVQYQEAWDIFIRSPILGIGDQMFIPISYQLFPNGVMSYFPENVHQGFFLFTIERGLIGLFIYLIFLYYLIKNFKQSSISLVSKTMLYSGIIAGFVMMLFHPEKNQLSLLLLIGIVLTHHEQKINKKN